MIISIEGINQKFLEVINNYNRVIVYEINKKINNFTIYQPWITNKIKTQNCLLLLLKPVINLIKYIKNLYQENNRTLKSQTTKLMVIYYMFMSKNIKYFQNISI